MQQTGSSISNSLRLQPGQQRLTPEQEAEAMRFATEQIEAQLSTGPVVESEAEEWLRHAYQVAGLEPPAQILWLDGPLHLVSLFLPSSVTDNVWASVRKRVGENICGSVGDDVAEQVVASTWASVGNSGVWGRVEDIMYSHVADLLSKRVRASVWSNIWANVGEVVWNTLWISVGELVRASVGSRAESREYESVLADVQKSVYESMLASVRAYYHAAVLALAQFLDMYLAPNDLWALAQFNELVSGYWLGQGYALLVRRRSGWNVMHKDGCIALQADASCTPMGGAFMPGMG
jgi:hypothetical protein